MAEVHFNSSYLFMIMVSFIVSVLVTPLIRFIALKYNFVDKPTSDRKVHRKAIPTLGGIALWLGFNAGMGVGFFLVPELTNVFIGQFIGLSAALLIICATGIYDDIYNLKAHIKLIIQIGVAVLLIMFGFEIELISKLFGDGSLPLGITDSFNYKACRQDITPGQIIAIATDGIFETQNPKGEMFGRQRFYDIIRQNNSRSAGQILKATLEAVDNFRKNLPPEDDLTLVVIKVKPNPDPYKADSLTS